LIKRITFLLGMIADPTEKHEASREAEELAEAIRKQRGESA
jgi:hypothetical protein